MEPAWARKDTGLVNQHRDSTNNLGQQQIEMGRTHQAMAIEPSQNLSCSIF